MYYSPELDWIRDCNHQGIVPNVLPDQGVVTCMSHAEAFATGIKIKSSYQSLFESWSRDNQAIKALLRADQGTIKQSSTLFVDQKSWSGSQTLQRGTYKWLDLLMKHLQPGSNVELLNALVQKSSCSWALLIGSQIGFDSILIPVAKRFNTRHISDYTLIDW